MRKYIISIIVLFAVAALLKSTVSYSDQTQTQPYIALPNRTQSMLDHCHNSDTPCSFLPFQYMRANRLRIQAVQYIWSDIYANYHPNLYDRLQDITTLTYDWEYPYILWQYLLAHDDVEESIQESLTIGKKWLASLCDMDDFQSIVAMSEEEYLSMYYSQDKLVPCERYLLPQSLWFVAFYYAQDIQQAIGYYRVAALAYDAPDTLVDMPAIITARYDNDRKSMLLRQQRLTAAVDQLNPELHNDDLFFLLSVMEHTVRKAVHHAFLSVIYETAQTYGCDEDYSCVQQYIGSVATEYLSQCTNDDLVQNTICKLLYYARDEWRWDGSREIVYPLEPQAFVYGRRPDLEKWDIVPR